LELLGICSLVTEENFTKTKSLNHFIILFRRDVTQAISMLHCGRCHVRRQKQKEREVHTHGMHLPDYVKR